MTKPSLGAVLQSEALLRQFAKDLLQVPRAHGTTTTHPLSVLLFLLDLLAFLHQSEASPAPGEATTEKGTVVGLGLLGDVTLSELPRGGGEEDGVLEAARRWERRNGGSAPSSPAVGSDELDSWKAFSGYLAELVSFSALLVALIEFSFPTFLDFSISILSLPHRLRLLAQPPRRRGSVPSI